VGERYRKTIRVGLASKLRLEVPPEMVERLPGPVHAQVGRSSKGNIVITFMTDTEKGTANWSERNDEFNYFPLQINPDKVVYNDPELEGVVFTFTEPEEAVWGRNIFQVTMPPVLRPPQSKQGFHRKAQTTEEVAAPPQPETQVNDPVEIQPAVQETSAASVSIDSAHPEQLVEALNRSLEVEGNKSVLLLRGGRVVIRAYLD
jgi:hypothetical protein